nr:hypothetical protein [Candidatus Nitrosoglobus terrae]
MDWRQLAYCPVHRDGDGGWLSGLRRELGIVRPCLARTGNSAHWRVLLYCTVHWRCYCNLGFR